MSVENQPDPILPNYNPSAWDPLFTSQEEAELDANYVKYPTAQTATITFPGVIKTPSVTSTANMTIASPSSSTMTIANAAQTTIFMGEGVRDGVGAGTVSHRYSGGNGALINNNVTLNNGDQNQSSTFIQCGPGTNANRSSGNVEIKTGLFNTGEVRIGQFTSDTNKTTTVIKGDLKANKIDANLASPVSSTVMSIGSNMLGGSVDIFTGANQKGSINMGQWTSDAPINKTSTNIEGDVNIASVTGGNTTIGLVGGTGNITLNRPITPAYSYPITDTTKIGFYESQTVTWQNAAFQVIATTSFLPVGIFLIDVCIATTGTYVPNFLYFAGNPIPNPGGSPNDNRIPFVNAGDRNLCSGSNLLYVSSGQTGNVTIANFAANAQTIQSGTVRIIRLA